MAKTATINININTKNAIRSIADLNNEIGDSIVTVNDLRMTVDSLQAELESTEVGTDRFTELKAALINANTELKNYELGIESLDNEQVASEIKSVVGGLTDMAGGFILVGASGQKMEELVQTFAMVEGASRIATGAMEGYNSLMKLQNNITTKAVAMKEAMTAATLGEGVSAKIASVGMGILNAVMAINPVFLLIAGIAALVAGLAIFFSSTNDAAEAQEKLNMEMEQSQRLMDVAQAQAKTMSNIRNQQIDDQKKIIDGQIALLEGLENLTEAQRQDLVVLKFRKKELEDESFQIITDEAVQKVKDNGDLINDTFANIRLAIKATDYEDAGGDNLEAGYASLLNKLQSVQTGFNNIKRAQESGTITNEQYLTGIQDLETKSAKLVGTFNKVQTELGADSDEGVLFAKAIENVDNLTKKFGESRVNAEGLINAIQAGKTNEILQQQTSELEDQQALQKQAEKDAKSREERQKKWLENRKKLLDEINSILSREQKALQGLQKARIDLVDNEFQKQKELADFTYGTQRDQLIQGAIQREKGILGEKFVAGKLSEQEYRDEIQRITDNGIDNLTESELKLLEAKKQILDKSLKDIDDAIKREALLRRQTIQDVDVIQKEITKIKLDKLKEEAQFVARQTIDDEIELQNRLLQINQQFSDREIQLVRDTEKEKLEARKAQYLLDIAAKDLSLEQKKKLEVEYNRDVVQIGADAQTEIVGILDSTVEATKTSTFELTEQQQLIFDTVVNTIGQSLQIINDALNQAAENAAAEREVQFSKEEEGLNKLLANKTLSQEQFDNKLKQLNQKKENEELKAKRKQFKRDKANDIIMAVIATAQAVLQGLAAGPPPVGPILAAINGALGAAQVGVIASQQFKAARGGVVPGSPSNVDSVSSLLAPGEMVINSTSAGMFGSLLSAVNQVGGGIPLAPPGTPITPPSPTFSDNGQQSVVKAYVVETDITQKQEKVSRIQRSSEF